MKQLYLLDVDDIVREQFFTEGNARATIRGLNANAPEPLSPRAGGLGNGDFQDQHIPVYNAAQGKFLSQAAGAAGAAGGHLKGNYPNPEINDKVVDPATHFSITGKQPLQIARVNAGGTAWESVTSKITEVANPSAPQANRLVRVNASGNSFEVADQGAAGARMLQHVVKKLTAVDSTAEEIPFDNSVPQNDEGKEYTSHTITPVSAASLIHIRFHATIAGAAGRGILALFSNADVNALHAVAGEVVSGNHEPTGILLECWLPSPGLVPTTYRIRFGNSDSGACYLNRVTDYSAPFGSARASFLLIEEILGTLT